MALLLTPGLYHNGKGEEAKKEEGTQDV